jgi:hypothetical protein
MWIPGSDICHAWLLPAERQRIRDRGLDGLAPGYGRLHESRIPLALAALSAMPRAALDGLKLIIISIMQRL